MSSEETCKEKTCSTYDWLCANPLASSFGTTLCSIYGASKSYNGVTSWTLGSVESAVGYASSKAQPLLDGVSGKLEGPIEYVDSCVAGGLKKLEDKYPVVGKPPSEIMSEGKQVVTTAISDGQEYLSNTRAGAIIGYGVDKTLNITEGLVDSILPPENDDEEASEEKTECEEPESSVAAPVKKTKKSWFGLRKRKQVVVKEDPEPKPEPEPVEVTASRSERAYNISYAIYYRSVVKLHSLQQQVFVSLQRLKTSLNLLQYAQSISSGVDKQRQSVAQALSDAEAKIRNYLSQKCKTKEQQSSYSWLSDGEDGENINWLIQPDSKKGIFQSAFEYAKTASGKVLESLQSLSSLNGYLPVRLRKGIENAIQQARDVYTTLKLNNVPAELPSFLLSQVLDVVETQMVFCKKLGGYITSFLLKARVGSATTPDDGSETSSQGVSEVRLDLDEEEEEENEDEDKI
ncbi:PREDICTED: uncharacterized protein LOC100632108 [Amphimedon queenslandica]|uniref:Perilipin n=1 Tax=Amphimedon queenslandica TaxID=400682 RepID=A0A1X7VI28_AMPQE|nr:PREDICTED: uncharacterized protein LOC100632108 [Amphimedon queenslandica]|eukprot:XP_003384104.1 PREDICTED: uncharacterized protein LOC100632108 [Amphimedon queenslandica]